MTKQIHIAVAAALLIAVSAPAFAEGMRCMNKVGLCDKGQERTQPDRSRSIGGGDAPASGGGETDTGTDTDTGEPDTSQPS